MPGYANPVITLRFPELAEEGDNIYVVIRNPRTMAAGELRAGASKADQERIAAAQAAAEANGGQVPDGMVTDEDEDRGSAIMAKLILGWRVWDTTVPVKIDPGTGDLIHDDETEPRLLPLPATPELVQRLPMPVINAIGQEIAKMNPTPTPADGTGRTS